MMNAIAETLEKERISHVVKTSSNHKEVLGQYFIFLNTLSRLLYSLTFTIS